MTRICRIQITVVISLLFFGGVIHRAQAGKLVGDYSPYQDQNPAEWQRYTARGEEFSVLLPEIPAMSTESPFVTRLNRDRQERIIGAYADGVVYAVYSFGNPKPRQSLNDLIAEVRTSRLSERDTSFHHDLSSNGFRGKQYAITRHDVAGVIQFYETQKHLYEFEAIGASESDPRVVKFISGLQLGKNPQGEEMKDGPGAELAQARPASSQSISGADDSAKPVPGKEVTRKPIVVTKPEPSYTGLARKHEVTGTVVLRVVFSSHGRVTNIREVVRLPDGLTEKAIAAARQIRFVPAIKDGRFVSMWMELQYNFNLY